MSVTESEIVSTEEKTLNNEDNIYSDLMTEIELGEENVQLMPEVKNINNCDQNIESADLSTENESSNILSRDVAVSEFFDTKNDEFIDNQDLIVSEVESEGIDFKNDTDVVNCTEEYEDKKLLFEDDDECTGLVEETDAAIQLADEDDAEIQLADNIAGEDEQYEIPNEDESLNRMHVMEDVEEGCNVSGALPSSPGHAEQRSATAKESAQETSSTDPQSPITNGIAKDDHQSDTDPQSPKSESEKQENGEIKTNERVKRKNSNAQREDIKDQSNEDSNSNDSLTNNKRKVEEEDSPAKKLRTQIQQQYVTHDRILTDYLESTGCSTIEDFQAQSEQLLAEIRTLNELAREKEREWNNILHLKKVKEELLLRLQRKRQILLLNAEKIEELDLANDNHLDFDNKKDSKLNNNGLMMVPIVSSSPANTKNNQTKNQLNNNNQNKHRPILPKPNLNLDASNEFKTGRQGPILDVRSIIADYRQRHPETVPRRGRRLRSVLNNSFGETMVTTSGKQGSIMNLTSQVLGSGAQVRHGDVSSELGLLLSTMDAVNKQDSRPSSADSSSIMNNETMSFKDVLVQFARLSQSERQELQAAAAASLGGSTNKPPYPEVTLHAVQNQTNSTTQNSNASLLHGILTKNQTKTDTSKPTTFSPTLARLLTAPERVSNTNAQAVYNAAAAALNSGVSISDLLTTPKSRNEITITPIGSQFGSNSKKDADNIADEEAEDSADRLVIDEGGQDASDNRQRGTDTGSDAGDDVPQCQGCHQKSAQFVCAGCGNQWYCSRDCQVAAWDEHSEVCSG